ncbi:MAG: DEAD/DEAH box helicase [Planctomycetota bacterium]
MIRFLDELNWQKHIDACPLTPGDGSISTWIPDQNPTSVPVVSAGFKNRRVKIKSFFFEPAFEDATKRESKTAGNDRKEKSQSRPVASTESPDEKPSSSRTRIRPPRDIIKLDDRLFYMLQPPLENLLSGNTLQFPFKPFSFQYGGIGFLFPRHRAILADEMGLGKTMQAITSVRMLLRTGQAKSVLLICPKPLVTNWIREFALWAPEVPVVAISGAQHQRQWHWKENPSPVKIANYELMIRDEPVFNRPDSHFDLVVLDEAQRIKNKNNSTSKVICDIPRSRSWALTGTPIENSLEDLVGICQFVSPGLVHGEMSPRQMKTELKDMILRRTKDLVMKDMPPRLIRDAELALSDNQAESYEKAESAGVLRLNDMGNEMTIKHVFELVLRLKQICNFDPATGESTKVERLKADLDEIAASGQKAIVFSQFVDTIDRISPHIEQHRPLAYHGRIPSKQRDPILDEFKNDPSRTVLLMSYGAGSVGLNLQFCRYVFLFDRWWNPAVEDQAINRAHRIGAAGSVTVTRMMMSGTIEQRIHEVLEAKRELFRAVLSDENQQARRGLTRDEIFGLFKLTTPQGTIRRSSDTKAA